MEWLPTFTWFSLLLIILLASSKAAHGQDERCEKVTVPLCEDLYNYTFVPNYFMGLDTQHEAGRRVHEFAPLFKINCARMLKFFVCSMFLPMCFVKDGIPTAIHACRPMCEKARMGCEPIMKRYGFDWPEKLDCRRLPEISNPKRLCMNAPESGPTSTKTGDETAIETWNFTNAEDFCKHNSHPSFVFVKAGNEGTCIPRCNASIMFSRADKGFARTWISVWSIICFLSTLLTVSTFLVDSGRFRYPERPIIFLSMCYNLYSIGYLASLFAGRDKIVCTSTGQERHLVLEGMRSKGCTVVFFILYFFGMASAIWWVILAFTWFLSAALKWGNEAVEKYSSIFHAFAWAIPTVQTSVALVTKKVDIDNLNGLCFIGGNDSVTLLWFVIIPLFVYLFLGVTFLVTGFIALVRIRRVLRVKEANINKLERLMVRIGVFSVLYTAPASFVVGCFLHEYFRLRTREQFGFDPYRCALNRRCRELIVPKVEILYLKHFMLLVVGVTSGVWIWSSKTLVSWKKCYYRCCGTSTNTKPLRRNTAGRNSDRVPVLVQQPRLPIHTVPGRPFQIAMPQATHVPVSPNNSTKYSIPVYTYSVMPSVAQSVVSQPSTTIQKVPLTGGPGTPRGSSSATSTAYGVA